MQINPTNAPVHPWIPSSQTGERVHIDYADPVGGMLLIVVDSYSKWPEVVIQNSTISEATVNARRTIFSREEVPHTLVSDNGPQFKSLEFKDFLSWLGVLHNPTSPYHPSSNGQAARFVQTVKHTLKAMAWSRESLQVRLDKFLLAYRNVPDAFTGELPAVCFMDRQLRIRLDSVKPNNQRENKQLDKQMERSSQNMRSFMEGDMVWVRDYLGKDKWVPETINKKCGPLTYQVTVSKGLWKRHIDQMSSRVNSSNMPLMQLELTAATDGHDYLVDTIPSLNQTNDSASGLTYEAISSG